MKNKYIKHILGMGCLCCTLVATLASCSSDDPYFTASENDAPRILNTDIPEGSDGQPATLTSIDRTQNFTFEAIVTPVKYTTVTWLIDGTQVAEGLSIDIPLLAGDHILQIVATTTKGLQTSRTCKVVVCPLATDPIPDNKQRERLVKPGTAVTLHGKNMEHVLKDTAINLVHAGTILRVYVEGNGQGSVTTSWWNNILTGKGDPERGDIMISGSQVLEYELTDYSMQLLSEQGGMFIVGDGYTINKVMALATA